MKMSSFQELRALYEMNDIMDFVYFQKCKKYLAEILASLPEIPSTKLHDIFRMSSIFIEYCRMYGYEYNRLIDDDRALYVQAYSVIALVTLTAFGGDTAKAIKFIQRHHRKEVAPWRLGYSTDNINTEEIISVLNGINNPTAEQHRLLIKAMRLAKYNYININHDVNVIAHMSETNFRSIALSMLKNDVYKKEASQLWDIIPNYFWHCPSSATGKYHAEDESLKGGNLLHTIRDMKVFMSLCEVENISDETFITEGLFALLFHDSIKQGWSRSGYQTCFEHPLLAGKLVRSHAHNISIDSRERIAKAIDSHNGRFTTSRFYEGALPLPQTQLEILVAEADYIASRRDFEIIL